MPLTPDEFRYYFLAHMAYNIAGGHHTFHECAILLKIAGLPYEEGNYTSVFPREFVLNAPKDPDKRTQSWLQSLKEEYSELFPLNLHPSEEPEYSAHIFKAFKA